MVAAVCGGCREVQDADSGFFDVEQTIVLPSVLRFLYGLMNVDWDDGI